MTASAFINFFLNFSRYFCKHWIIVQPARESPFLAWTLPPKFGSTGTFYQWTTATKGTTTNVPYSRKYSNFCITGQDWSKILDVHMSKSLLYLYMKERQGPGKGFHHQGCTFHFPTRSQFLPQPRSRAAISVWVMLQINSPLAWLSCQAPPACNEPMNYILQLWHLWACSSKYCSSIVIYNLI